jgi:hypothetical protein
MGIPIIDAPVNKRKWRKGLAIFPLIVNIISDEPSNINTKPVTNRDTSPIRSLFKPGRRITATIITKITKRE